MIDDSLILKCNHCGSTKMSLKFSPDVNGIMFNWFLCEDCGNDLMTIHQIAAYEDEKRFIYKENESVGLLVRGEVKC